MQTKTNELPMSRFWSKSINQIIFKENANNILNSIVCGSLAGITSVTTTYPLDVIRSRFV